MTLLLTTGFVMAAAIEKIPLAGLFAGDRALKAALYLLVSCVWSLIDRRGVSDA